MTWLTRIIAASAILLVAGCAGVTVEPLPRSEIPEIADPAI